MYMYLQLQYYNCITAQPSSLKKYKEGLAEEEFQTPAYFFQMNSCQVEEGRLARFDCRVVAHPKPEITWLVRNLRDTSVKIVWLINLKNIEQLSRDGGWGGDDFFFHNWSIIPR